MCDTIHQADKLIGEAERAIREARTAGFVINVQDLLDRQECDCEKVRCGVILAALIDHVESENEAALAAGRVLARAAQALAAEILSLSAHLDRELNRVVEADGSVWDWTRFLKDFPTRADFIRPLVPFHRGAAAHVGLIQLGDGSTPRLAVCKVASSQDPVVLAMFVHEQQLHASLKTLAVVPLLASGAHRGRPYIITAYAREGTLEAYCVQHRRGRKRREWNRECIAIVSQLSDAVSKIHDETINSKAVVHGDIKPANVLIEHTTGEQVPIVKLCDFGNASLSAQGHFAVRATAAFAAPEQLHNGTLDAKVDIYALGGVLFYLLTRGRNPNPEPAHLVESSTASKLWWRWRLRRLICRRIPLRMSAVVLRATRTTPRGRYESVKSLKESLDSILGRRGRQDSCLAWRWVVWGWHRPLFPAIVLTVVLGIVGVQKFNEARVSALLASVRNGVEALSDRATPPATQLERARELLATLRDPWLRGFSSESRRIECVEFVLSILGLYADPTRGTVGVLEEGLGIADEVEGLIRTLPESTARQHFCTELAAFRAQILMRLGRTGDAVAAVEGELERLRQASPHSDQASAGVLGMLALARGARFVSQYELAAEALGLAERDLNMVPEDEWSEPEKERVRLEIVLERGLVFQDGGDIKEARGLLDEAAEGLESIVDIRPYDGRALNRLVDARIQGWHAFLAAPPEGMSSEEQFAYCLNGAMVLLEDVKVARARLPENAYLAFIEVRVHEYLGTLYRDAVENGLEIGADAATRADEEYASAADLLQGLCESDPGNKNYARGIPVTFLNQGLVKEAVEEYSEALVRLEKGRVPALRLVAMEPEFERHFMTASYILAALARCAAKVEDPEAQTARITELFTFVDKWCAEAFESIDRYGYGAYFAVTVDSDPESACKRCEGYLAGLGQHMNARNDEEVVSAVLVVWSAEGWLQTAADAMRDLEARHPLPLRMRLLLEHVEESLRE